MNLKPQHKKYILKHEEDIRKGDWKEFFKPKEYPDGIGEPLYLTKIPFMEYLKRVPAYAFCNCKELTSITIPDNVTSIDEGAFGGCLSLTSITIPEGVTSIGDSAFQYCNSFTSITIPSSVTNIGENAFFGCIAITSIRIPNSVTYIGDNSFSYMRPGLVITYDGTKQQWKQIYNSKAFKYTYFTVKCSDGQIVKKRK